MTLSESLPISEMVNLPGHLPQQFPECGKVLPQGRAPPGSCSLPPAGATPVATVWAFYKWGFGAEELVKMFPEGWPLVGSLSSRAKGSKALLGA